MTASSAVYVRLISCFCPPHQLCMSASSVVYVRLISCVCPPHQLCMSAFSLMYVRLFSQASTTSTKLWNSFSHRCCYGRIRTSPSEMHVLRWNANLPRQSLLSLHISIQSCVLTIKQKYFNWIKISHLPHGSASQCLESIYLHEYIYLGSLH